MSYKEDGAGAFTWPVVWRGKPERVMIEAYKAYMTVKMQEEMITFEKAK